MRCPKCNLEFNAHSERCPNCGTSAKLARPDGDTMTRVRRQIATMRGQMEEQTDDVKYTSFSPVMKFDGPTDENSNLSNNGEKVFNPADNFDTYEFHPVNINEFLEKKHEEDEKQSDDAAEQKHRIISAEIRQMVSNKDDDLLAEYYFDDGISDLECYQLEESYKALEKSKSDNNDNNENNENLQEKSIEAIKASNDVSEPKDDEIPEEKELSEAAKRLSVFPEEKGLDKILTGFFEKYDAGVLKLKKLFKDKVYNKIKLVYRKFDEKTANFLNLFLDKYYYIKFKGLKRKLDDNEQEKKKIRKIIWSVCGVILISAICLVIFVTSLFTDGVAGQWIVSYDGSGQPNIITEFTVGGKAVVSVKSDDGWHVHVQGTYKTQRKNGHDMLTITYEDGTISRLYYTIEGDKGTFRNVETNAESVYTLK